MQVNFTPEQEAQLSQAAHFNGRAAEQIVQEATLSFLNQQQAEFLAAVDEGIVDPASGNLVDHEEVWARVKNPLKS